MSKFSNSFSEETWFQKYKAPTDTCVQDTWQRVAKDLASVEKDKEYWEKEFYSIMEDFKFVPGGRITSNAGTQLTGTTYINCFVAGTQVLTSNGYKSIELINIGDEVLTHTGKWKRVVNTLKTYHEQVVMNSYKDSTLINDGFTCTENHKFWSSEHKWVSSKELTELTFLFRDWHSDTPSTILDTEFGDIRINTNLCYFLGRFVGDGSTFGHYTGDDTRAFNLVFSNKEVESLNRIKTYLDSELKLDTHINKSTTFDGLYIRKQCPLFATLLKELCGDNCYSKKVPNFIWKTSKENIEAFLLGLFDADGTITKKGEVKLVTTSKQLIKNVSALLWMINIPNRLTLDIPPAKLSTVNTHRVWFSVKNGIDFVSKMNKIYDDNRIDMLLNKEHVDNGLSPCMSKNDYNVLLNNFGKTRFDYEGFVYNISVEDDHSYVVSNIIAKNCFVDGFQDTNQDSVDGIYSALHRQASILKSEGGYGFCIDVLRPCGAHITGIANQSPGAVKFAELWDKSSEIITAGSGKKSRKDQKNFIRKGAQMITMSCWHPDIIEYIEAKKTPGRLSKFNMSVLCTDKFMQAVENDKDWELIFPNYEKYPALYKKHWDGNINKWKQIAQADDAVIVYETIKARSLWERIMENTYNRNEPGVLFVDNMNKMNNLYYCEWINATNPSLRKGTYLLTKDGPKQIQNLENSVFEVANLKNGYSKASCRLSGKNKRLYKVLLNSGFEYFATAEHRWATNRGELTTVELSEDDQLPILKRNNAFNGSLGDFEDGFLLGWLLGDGWITIRNDNHKKQIGMIVSSKDFECGIAEKLENILKKKTGFTGKFNKRERNGSIWYEINTQNQSIVQYLEQFDFNGKDQGVPSKIFENGSDQLIKGLIDGYLSSDGYVSEKNKYIITFVSKNQKLLSDISEILGFFGIRTSLKSSTTQCYPNQFPNKKMYSKKYTRNDLNIQDKDSLKHFSELFSSSIAYKQERLLNFKLWNREKGSPIDYNTVVSVEETDIYEDVWDITVYDEDNCFSLSHCITHNCGEQILPIGGVCLLGSINLVHFIDIENGKWKYDELKNTIHTAIRLMDNVNDRTYVPLPSQVDNLKNKRRIGLGVLGYGSALLMAKVRYGSDKALKMTEELMRFFTEEAYLASSDLAAEKGSFLLFDKEKYLNSEFIKQLSQKVKDSIRKYGMRNSHVTSIQPTGNSSCYANLVSGGLEPLFMHGYVRTSIQPVAPDGLSVPRNVDWSGKKFEITGEQEWKWVKEGDEDLLLTSFKDKVWKYDRTRGLLKEEWIEDYGVSALKARNEWDSNSEWAACTMDLGVKEHVDTMAIFAKWVDSAISKTVNLTNDYPYKDFKEVYTMAWKNGIKGFTTYRAGTMTAVLSAESSSKNTSNTDVKRPKELDCDIHHIKVKGTEYLVFVGMLNDSPYEVFACENGILDKSVTSGKIVKMGKKGIYKAVADDIELSPINATCTPEEDALTRMTSMTLRCGSDVHQVVKQLEKVKGDMNSFAKCIARALKKYIPDGTKESGHCPDCGQDTLIRQEGCITCISCGYSKCS